MTDAVEPLMAPQFGSLRFDPDTHVPVPSSGCGKPSIYALGRTSIAKVQYAGTEWEYRIYVPSTYSSNEPLPIIIQHPGWGLTAEEEQIGCGITLYAEERRFISVTAQGADDNAHPGGPWWSWNAAGTSISPGPAGPTCAPWSQNTSLYCYESCEPCSEQPQCKWTTCKDTLNPVGTEMGDNVGLIPRLYDTLEDRPWPGSGPCEKP